MTEPLNSWEVSYILSIYRPNINLSINHRTERFKLTEDRKKELRAWAELELDGKWVKDHI